MVIDSEKFSKFTFYLGIEEIIFLILRAIILYNRGKFIL